MPGALTTAQYWSALAERAWRRGQAEPDAAAALHWFERARRIAPADHTVALSLALAHLRTGDRAAAAALFQAVATAHDVAEAWIGLAASRLRQGDTTQAADAIGRVLSRHVASAAALDVARQLGGAWCAVGGDGKLHAAGPSIEVMLDDAPWRPRWAGGAARLPAKWRQARRLDASSAGHAVVGSPLDLASMNAVEGCVEVHAGGLRGWAWHPADPARDPVLDIAGRVVVASDPVDWSADRPLARPRAFAVAASDLPPGEVHVIGGGRDLLGSPLDPGAEQRSAAGLSRAFCPVWADVVGPAPVASPGRRAVDVVIPVYRGLATTLACLHSVLATVPPGTRIHVVDDASPDPALVGAMDDLARAGRINLVRHPRNLGFPAAANAGIAASAGRDVVLLNSDTLVPPGWLERLQDASYAQAGIGTACPLSNDATILSYPDPAGGNPTLDLDGTARMAALAARANGDALADIPTAVGSCMFIRRDCLDQVGALREDVFAQGYGEENDFCLRARHHGWRHLAVLGAFVAHVGAASFGAARTHLIARNIGVLNRLHPGYDALIARFIADDSLAPARRRMDMLRWREARREGAVILVSHSGGGGVDRVIAARCEAIAEAGARAIVLRPDEGFVTVAGAPNLRYALPGEMAALVQLLRPEKPSHVEFHHLLGHSPAVLDLPARLGIPHEVHVHDYAWFCPRIALVSAGRYCGEPDLAGCEACIADHGSLLEEPIAVAALVARSAGLLGTARRVVTASPDAASRLRRHFPGQAPVVTPWDDDAAIPPPPPPDTKGAAHICVVGGIGVEKGFDVLLACVRDAAARGLPLRFTVVGHTSDDQRLMEAGPAFVTGSYHDAEVVELIRAQHASFAWLPSIWPETWCFTLGHAWRAGLRVSVFDIGAPAVRVRRTGWGWVAPLGLPPGALNDAHLRISQTPPISVMQTR